MSMNVKTNFEYVGFYESVTVVVKSYDFDEQTTAAFIMCNDFEGENGLRFNDVLNEAKRRGYAGGTILLILESFLDGKIYRYGNYRDDKWYEVGEMRGFA